MEIRKLGHASPLVKDVDRSRHFYGQVPGMQEVPRPSNMNVPDAWLRKESAEIHLIGEAEPGRAAQVQPGYRQEEACAKMDPISGVARHQFTDLNQLAVCFQLGTFTCEVQNWGFFEPHWWRNHLHLHSFFEVCYAYAGRGTFRIQGQDYQVQAGEAFVAKPGEPHEIISSQDDPLGIYYWSYTLSPSAKSSDEFISIDTFTKAFLTSQQAVSTRTPTMLRTLELLTEEVARKEPGYLQAIEGLVFKLILDTARAVIDVPLLSVPLDPPAKCPEEIVVQVMLRYLRDNYSRQLSIGDLAAQVNLSERHAGRLFRNVTGTSIKEYLTSLRIEKAIQLLLDGRTPIKEIALATGYPDVRYFTTLFRQRVGLPPASFRRNGGTRFLSDH